MEKGLQAMKLELKSAQESLEKQKAADMGTGGEEGSKATGRAKMGGGGSTSSVKAMLSSDDESNESNESEAEMLEQRVKFLDSKVRSRTATLECNRSLLTQLRRSLREQEAGLRKLEERTGGSSD